MLKTRKRKLTAIGLATTFVAGFGYAAYNRFSKQ